MKCFLSLIFLMSTFWATQAGAQDKNLTELTKVLLKDHPDILYIMDTNHNDNTLLSLYIDILTEVKRQDKEYNCVFVEADKKIFQPAISTYMSGKKSWKGSVGRAQKKWQKITGRPYKQAPEEFLKPLRTLKGIKVFAVDWADDTDVSETMKDLFKEGFSNKNMDALRMAFSLGVDTRNYVMGANIAKLMNGKQCKKGVMFLGGLHVAKFANMPMGPTQYTSVAEYPSLKKKFKQTTSEIISCEQVNKGKISKVLEGSCKSFKKDGTRQNRFKKGEKINYQVIKKSSEDKRMMVVQTYPKLLQTILIQETESKKK